MIKQDRRDDALSMTIVVKDTKDFTITQLAETVAIAVASFTPVSYVDAPDNWKEWNETNFRKILKRMKPNQFDKIAEKTPETIDKYFYRSGSENVEVVVFEPLRKSEKIDALKTAQVSHFTTVDEELSSVTKFGVPVVTLNKELNMSAGKASVAAAHALQKLREHMFVNDSLSFQMWEAHKRIHVRWDSIDENDDSVVVIHDSGLTEVIPGSITAVAEMKGSPFLR